MHRYQHTIAWNPLGKTWPLTSTAEELWMLNTHQVCWVCQLVERRANRPSKKTWHFINAKLKLECDTPIQLLISHENTLISPCVQLVAGYFLLFHTFGCKMLYLATYLRSAQPGPSGLTQRFPPVLCHGLRLHLPGGLEVHGYAALNPWPTCSWRALDVSPDDMEKISGTYVNIMWKSCENHVKIMWKLWEDSGDNYGEKLWGKLWRLGKICWHRFWLRESGEDGTLLRWGGKAMAWSSKCIYVHMSLHESMGFYHISLMKTKNYLWNIWKGCIVNGYTYIYLYIIYILCRFKNAVVRQL